MARGLTTVSRDLELFWVQHLEFLLQDLGLIQYICNINMARCITTVSRDLEHLELFWGQHLEFLRQALILIQSISAAFAGG